MIDYRSISIEVLLQRCVDSQEFEAWEEFVRRFRRLIASVVLRTARRYGEISERGLDDLIQETYFKLCANDYKILRNFKHEHENAFLGFIKIVAVNVTRDHFKATYARKRGSEKELEAADFIDPAADENAEGSPRSIERAILIQEIERHLNSCTQGPDQEKRRTIFWLYYRVGLSAAAIGALPAINLTTKGVESTILRTTREIRDRLSASQSRISTQATEIQEGILFPESF